MNKKFFLVASLLSVSSMVQASSSAVAKTAQAAVEATQAANTAVVAANTAAVNAVVAQEVAADQVGMLGNVATRLRSAGSYASGAFGNAKDHTVGYVRTAAEWGKTQFDKPAVKWTLAAAVVAVVAYKVYQAAKAKKKTRAVVVEQA